MTEVCAHLQAVVETPEGLPPVRDLVINVPPGMSKSVITSVLWPVWAWTLKPHWKFIFTSYSEKLVNREADRSMRLVLSDWFQERWGKTLGLTIVDGMRAAAGFYENTRGGMRYSVQMGGQVTGFHGHVLVADDPHKVSDVSIGGDSAKNTVEGDVFDWNNTFSNRTADPINFKRLVIMQRVHEVDISQQMVDAGATHLRLPMEFEAENPCKTPYGGDWRTEEGELLAPARFPAEVVALKKTQYTPLQYAAQCQQRPAPADGIIFRQTHFANRFRGIPAGINKLILSVDATFKKTDRSDYCIVQCWGARGAAEFFLLDQLRERAGLAEAIQMIRQMKAKWPRVSSILVEDKANGSAIIQTLRNELPGVLPVNPEGGKEARANAVEPYFAANNISFPADDIAPWMKAFVAALTGFPNARFDDEVDAATQAVLYLTGQLRMSQSFSAAMQAVRAQMSGAAQPGPKRGSPAAPGQPLHPLRQR